MGELEWGLIAWRDGGIGDGDSSVGMGGIDGEMVRCGTEEG